MNELRNFNRAIDYFEDNLDGQIDWMELGYTAGCGSGLFTRVFSILSGYTLGEYIRFRRLTKAAQELQFYNSKVIDCAIKYGYESVDAFSSAFKKFHGKTPTSVRQGSSFKVFSAIRFTLQVEGGSKMEVRIETRKGFKIAGLSMKAGTDSDFAGLWQRLFDRVAFERLAVLGDGSSFGACYEMDGDSFRYMAGYDVKRTEEATNLGLEIIEVPEARYAVVSLIGPIPDSIHRGWKYIMGIFLPEHGYEHACSPDFELYFEGDMGDSDYRMELWVPIVKRKDLVEAS